MEIYTILTYKYKEDINFGVVFLFSL